MVFGRLLIVACLTPLAELVLVPNIALIGLAAIS